MVKRGKRSADAVWNLIATLNDATGEACSGFFSGRRRTGQLTR